MNWQEERLINAPIDVVWPLFEKEQVTRIMPKVVGNRWLDKKQEWSVRHTNRPIEKENEKKPMWWKLRNSKIRIIVNVNVFSSSLHELLKWN